MKKKYIEMSKEELIKKGKEWLKEFRDLSSVTVYKTKNDAGILWNEQQSLPNEEIIFVEVLKRY